MTSLSEEKPPVISIANICEFKRFITSSETTFSHVKSWLSIERPHQKENQRKGGNLCTFPKSERKGVIFYQGRGSFSTQRYASYIIIFDNFIYKSEYAKKLGIHQGISYEFYLVEGLYVDTLISHQAMEQTLQIPFLV